MALQFRGTGADGQRITLIQPIQPGIVIAAYIRATSGIREPYQLYAQCGIAADDKESPVNSKVVFVEGYVAADRPLSWTGVYIMHPNDQFYLILTGDLSQSVNADVRRVPNTTRKALEEILAAVIPSA